MERNREYPYYPTPSLGSLQELISYCAENYKEQTVFRYMTKGKETHISYQKFFEDVAASFFAIVNSNNVVVPLDKELNANDINKIILRSDTTVLIHSDDYTEEANANENITLINMNSFFDIIPENNTEKCRGLCFMTA